jgi:hypothetical protein
VKPSHAIAVEVGDDIQVFRYQEGADIASVKIHKPTFRNLRRVMRAAAAMGHNRDWQDAGDGILLLEL